MRTNLLVHDYLIRLAFVVFLHAFPFLAFSQDYKNPDLPVEVRVNDLLSRMTPEEKFWQLFMIPGDLEPDSTKYVNGIFGFQVNTVGHQRDASEQMLAYSARSGAYETAEKINRIQRFFVENTRLGIPIIAFDETLHGLVREGATAFPQAIGLAASWNTELMNQVAQAIALESKTRGIRQVLSPVVNIANDVRWGRTEETYGEDPFLCSGMGVAYVRAFEELNVVTTPKHLVANVGEGGRDSYPIEISERQLKERFLPPFEACITQGGSRSIMTAYNSFDGSPCTANDYLLNGLLKETWGFDGIVISDAGATGGANVLHFTASDYGEATAKSINAGLDVVFQTSYDHTTLFMPPFLDGSLSHQAIDEAVKRVLRLKMELGLFENPYVDPRLAAQQNGKPEHRELAKQAALESFVLLKNQHNVLPLGENISSVAVIGSDAVEKRLGGYSGPGNQVVSILEGLQQKKGASAQISYARGCDRNPATFSTIPETSLSCVFNGKTTPGLLGSYFNTIDFSGDPAFTRVDKQIQFQWTLFSPDPEKINYDFYSVRWKGELVPDTSGFRKIGIDGNDGYRLYIDEKLVLDNWVKRGREIKTVDFFFEAGKSYDLRIDYHEPAGNAWFRLIWDVVDDETAEMEKAVRLAQNSDLAIVVAGIEEGEFRDRAYLNLPGRQEELINKVAATGTPVIVLLVGGSAITMSHWIEKVQSVVQLWYPGEAGGLAVADLLFGDYNPAGRLPITFPVFEGQLPLVYNHKPTGRGDDYVNLTGQALFPFGFGLSYTTFEYSNLTLDKNECLAGDTVIVSCTVTNTGNLAGDEVVQLYLTDELASVARPVKELKGFKRIHLEPGESTEVSLALTPDAFEMLDKNMKKTIEPGNFRLMVGASSKDIRLRSLIRITDNSRK